MLLVCVGWLMRHVNVVKKSMAGRLAAEMLDAQDNKGSAVKET